MWWFVRRPRTRGALVAVWRGDEVLLVRSSYRSLLLLPGGFVRTGESAVDAARRELAEELSIHLAAGALTFAWEGTIAFEHRHDTVTIFEAADPGGLSPRPAGGEIVWAAWVPWDDALRRPLLPHVRAYLRERRAPSATPAAAAPEAAR